MEKKYIEKKILNHYFSTPLTYKEIKNIIKRNNIILNDDDVIEIEGNEGDIREYLTITRKVLETDEEYSKRIENEQLRERIKEKRELDNLLVLKRQYENDNLSVVIGLDLIFFNFDEIKQGDKFITRGLNTKDLGENWEIQECLSNHENTPYIMSTQKDILNPLGDSYYIFPKNKSFKIINIETYAKLFK